MKKSRKKDLCEIIQNKWTKNGMKKKHMWDFFKFRYKVILLLHLCEKEKTHHPKKNTITNKNVDANGKVFLCLEQLVVARLDVLYNLGMGWCIKWLIKIWIKCQFIQSKVDQGGPSYMCNPEFFIISFHLIFTHSAFPLFMYAFFIPFTFVLPLSAFTSVRSPIHLFPSAFTPAPHYYPSYSSLKMVSITFP